MNMGVFPSSDIFPIFFSSKTRNSCCTGLSLAWLVLHQGIFLLFQATVKGVYSLISFSAHLLLVDRRAMDIFELILFPVLTKGVYQL